MSYNDYDNGKLDGYNEGYADGYKDGQRDCLDEQARAAKERALGDRLKRVEDILFDFLVSPEGKTGPRGPVGK